MEKFKNFIKEKIKKYYKIVLFVIIFFLFCLIYNQNSQTINFYLRRGTILEYSINENQKINKDNINSELSNLKIKYSLIEEKEFENPIYDFQGNKIYKKLVIILPYIAKQDKQNLFNNVSDFVFKNYPNSELIDVKMLGNLYSKKYAGFCIFLSIFIFSFLIWYLILNTFSSKNFSKEIKEYILKFFNHQKEELKKLNKDTKEKGIGYFFKKILLDTKEDEENQNITKEIISTIVFVLVAVIVIRYFVGELRWIPTESMFPTIKKRDRVYVEKLEYPKRTIERGDILVFYPPQVELSNSPFAVFSRLTGIFCKDIAYIKRTIGLPGDKFEIKYLSDANEYRVFINDVVLNEPYVNNISNSGYEYPPKGYDGIWTPCTHPDVKYCGPFIIPEGKYFMMGDNRGNSADSRFWGFLDEDRIIGRANFMFWPLGRINLMRDKYVILNAKIENNKEIQKKFIVDRYSI